MTWTIAVVIIFCVVANVSDIKEHDPAEIGIMEGHKFHIGMYLGHPRDAEAGLIMFSYALYGLLLLNGIAYCLVLLFQSVSAVGKMKANGVDRTTQQEGSKLIVLICLSSMSFVLFMIPIGMDWDIKYFLSSSAFVIVDTFLVFLTFKSNDQLYGSLCGRICGNCCIGHMEETHVANVINQENENLIEM